jgi:hypothetical protein
MGISEALAHGSDLSDSNNEKSETQFVENTVPVSSLTGQPEDGKLTKETILAYIVGYPYAVTDVRLVALILTRCCV